MSVTVLIVDDEAGIRNAVVTSMKRAGYRVLSAKDGSSAIKIALAEPIDLIISDVRMPNGDGVDLLKNIRSRDWNSPAVVLMSGYSSLKLEDAYDCGADGMLIKPFGLKALHAIVEKALIPPADRWAGPADSPAEPLWVSSFVSVTATLGRGGLFVASSSVFPSPDTDVRFEITDLALRISGTGKVRWVRGSPSAGFPAGFGLEFFRLSEDSRKIVAERIARIRPQAYIPKR